MAENIILDLGQYGEVLVEPSGTGAGGGEGLVPASRVGQNLKVSAEKLFSLPMTGIARIFLASLPADAGDEQYELDGFELEFSLGIEAEAGANLGAVAKVTPNGSFKCTYTWRRKAAKVQQSPA